MYGKSNLVQGKRKAKCIQCVDFLMNAEFLQHTEPKFHKILRTHGEYVVVKVPMCNLLHK